ncbi:Gfo/Idh/MocA family oxidoreductase [Candidatus Poriferisodalis sp.]|uniref:Gfo/Idh/MocA family oxidoreductase n=1 Tax=Candidatus Poriferisodalis sp. TaxID=3101277 RepID=UPI003AF72F4C
MSSAAVIGAGAVGQRIARQLASRDDMDRLVLGSRHPARLRGFASQLLDVDVEVVEPGALPEVDVVVLSLPSGGHTALAEKALERGAHVVSLSGAVTDVEKLLALDKRAKNAKKSVVVGAGFSPGYSCLLARHGAAQFDVVTEIHIARVGTGGPASQRQLHRARTGTSVDWRDGDWRRRRGGSGRELVWFPDPLGAHDCYRAALSDALLLVPAFNDIERVTARVAGTRRDRLTAMLPMLRPPHPEGGPGGVRVELRGTRDGRHCTDVLGVIDHPSAAAAAVAATATRWALADELPSGAWGLGMLDDPLPWLAELAERGVRAAAYEGARL